MANTNSPEHSAENSALNIHTPDWVKHAVFYQIFPDRFAKAEPPADQSYAIASANLQPWGHETYL
jgi:hypothetical protein